MVVFLLFQDVHRPVLVFEIPLSLQFDRPIHLLDLFLK